jgi:hypothetical protein
VIDVSLPHHEGGAPIEEISISAVGWLSSVGLSLGRKPLTTGDEAFDKVFAVKSADADFALTVLLPELRAQMIDVWDINDVRGTIHVRESGIHYEEPNGLRTDAQVRRFTALAFLCCKLGAVVEAARAIRS